MKRTLSLLLVTALILFAITGCKKKEEQPAPAPQQQGAIPQGPIIEPPVQQSSGQPGQMPPGHGTPGAQMPKVEFQVVVPQEVKDAWSSVKFIVEDKTQNKKLEATAPIGGEMKIPDSNLTVKIGPFLPDFKMGGDTITSSTNNLNNPAVGVAVYENGTQIFPASGKWGWLYQKFPAIHAFQHERFALTLKEGVKK